MPLLAMKPGGTSVADLARIATAAKKVEAEVARGFDVMVIVSARSGKTLFVHVQHPGAHASPEEFAAGTFGSGFSD